MIRKLVIFDILLLNVSIVSDKFSSDYGKYFINYPPKYLTNKPCDPGGPVWCVAMI